MLVIHKSVNQNCIQSNQIKFGKHFKEKDNLKKHERMKRKIVLSKWSNTCAKSMEVLPVS